jgi:tetratricopeptide (TPR) repeat protein
MNKKYTYLIAISLIVASLVAFGRISSNGFINYDEELYITKNDHVKSGLNLETIKWSWTAVVCSNWHPLTLISHAMDWSIFQDNAGGHHFVSLILHIASVLLLFLFLNKSTKNLWPSAFAAAFFALHPLRVESVAWAAERKDVLSMFFGMASIYVYAFYAENHKLSNYLLCLILFTFSLMSKSMLVTLPLVLLLLDYWPLKRWGKTPADDSKASRILKTLIMEKFPFIGLSIAVSIIALWTQKKGGSIASEDILPLLARCLHALVSYAAYLGKIFFPCNLALFYPYYFSLPLWKLVVSVSILAGITSFTIYAIKKLPFLFVGWFWYLITLIPVIGLVQIGKQSMADRYTYLPSIGIAVMLAWGIPLLFTKEKTKKNILLPAGIVTLTILTVLTWQQCGYWKNSNTIWMHTLQATKDNYLAHNNLGIALFRQGRIKEALDQYNKALLIAPNYFDAYGNRGNAYAQMGQHQQAMNDYTKAISLKPNSAEAYCARGTYHGRLGQYEQALLDLTKAISLNPHYFDAYNNRGIVLNQLHLFQQAINDFNVALQLKQGYVNAMNNRAFSYLNLGNIEAGCSDAKFACNSGNCKALEWAKSKGFCF